MRSLNDPSSCFESRILFPLHFFLPARFYVRSIMPTLEKLANVFRIVAFVQADMLMATPGGLGSGERDAVESRLKKLDVVRVRAAHLHAQRGTTSVGQYRSFCSQLAAIGRVFASIFPHPEAIWSSLRQRFANSTGCLEARRTPGAMLSTVGERHPRRSTAENNDGVCFPNHTRGELLSTGNPCEARRKYLEPQFADQPAVGPLGDFDDSGEVKLASVAKVPREDARNNVISVSSPLKTPPCWLFSNNSLYGS
jgi:hypothetical protein